MTRHSFGGSHLDRHLFDFMPDDGTDTGGADGAGVAVAEPAAGDAGAAADQAAVAAGAEPGGDQTTGDTGAAAAPGPDLGFDPQELQAELEHLREQNGTLVQRFEQLTAARQDAAPGDDQPPGVDLLDPESFTRYMAWERQQTLNAMRDLVNAPIQEQRQAAIEAEGEQRIADMIADDVTRNGEFITGNDPDQLDADKQARQLVRTLAEQMWPTYMERYGVTPRAGELAIAKAADQVRTLLKAAGKTAVVQNDTHLANLAEGRGDVSSAGGGAGAVQGVSTEMLTPAQRAQKWGTRP